MVDPFTIAGTIFSLAKIINQAHDIVSDLKAAPSEFKKIAADFQSLIQVLEPFHSNLVNTRPKNLGPKKQSDLLRHCISKCDASVNKVQQLLDRYRMLRKKNTWDAWRWSRDGRQATESLMDDLRDQVQLVSMVLHEEEREDISNVKHAVEANGKNLQRVLERLGMAEESNVEQLLRAVFLISRLKAMMHAKRVGGIGKSTRRISFTRVGLIPVPRRNSIPIAKPQPVQGFSSSPIHLVASLVKRAGPLHLIC